MKKQVLGHGTRQAPANRNTGFYMVIFRRCDNGKETQDARLARKWYDNGNAVTVTVNAIGYLMRRNSAGMTPTGYSKGLFYLKRKGGDEWTAAVDARIARYTDPEKWTNWNTF